MKAVTTALLAVAAMASGAASAMPTPTPPPVPLEPISTPPPITDALPNQGLTASLSTDRAGARPVIVTLALTYPMRCGHPGPGSLVVTFPGAERLPNRIPASAVLLNNHAAASVKRSGNDVTIALPRPSGISCNVIGPGKLTVVFTRSARLGNPPRAGSYQLAARTKNLVLRTMLRIRST